MTQNPRSTLTSSLTAEKSLPFDIFNLTKKWAQGIQTLYLQTHEICESTNDLAKKTPLPSSFQRGLFLTRHQTKGRGRSSHLWLDQNSGEALLSSWAFKLHQPPQHLTGPFFGLALFRAVSDIWPNMKFSLKAPNDLYLNEQKVSGLLIESFNDKNEFYLIVGLGINVFSSPPQLPQATHLVQNGSSRDEFTSNRWRHFLDRLLFHFIQAAQVCGNTLMDKPQQRELLKALNLFPHLGDKIIALSPEGHLITTQGMISWTDL